MAHLCLMTNVFNIKLKTAPLNLKRKMILPCVHWHVSSELVLTALPTPVFSAQSDTDAHIPWRFGAKHSVQHPASPPCEQHPILLWCTETRPKPSSLNPAQPMLQALSPACLRQAVPTCRARTNIPNHLHQSSKHHPGCSHRLGCCYQPSNNHGTKETTDKNNPGTNRVTHLVINTQTRYTLMYLLPNTISSKQGFL